MSAALAYPILDAAEPFAVNDNTVLASSTVTKLSMASRHGRDSQMDAALAAAPLLAMDCPQDTPFECVRYRTHIQPLKAYDALGNLRSKTFSNWNGAGARTVTNNYSSKNRIASSIDTANIAYGFGYDTRGNVTQTGLLNFTYDRSDQPVAMNGTAPNTGTSINASYLYDGNMKRVKSVVNGKTIYNVYDASGKLVHVDEATDNKQTDYLHGMGQTLARIKNGEFTYLHPDHLGSPQVGTNEAGSIAFNEYYTPFGEALLNPAANDNQSGFTGHIKDKSTGLNYMQARYYDPNIGRFLSIDPVTFLDTGNPGMFNRYAYTYNNPVNLVDPFGMKPTVKPKEETAKERRQRRKAQKRPDSRLKRPIKGGTVAGSAAAVGAGLAQLIETNDYNKTKNEIDRDRKSYKAIGRFAHSDQSTLDGSKINGRYWFPMEEMISSDDPANLYGIPDGEFPGPNSIMRRGGINDMKYITIGFIPKSIIGTPAVDVRVATPWPNAQYARRSGGGTEYFIPNPNIIMLKKTYVYKP